MSKYSRQNTLRVTTIQRTEEYEVDSKFEVHSGDKLKTTLKAIISKFFFEEYDDQDIVALNALYGKFLHHLELGIEELRSSWQRQALDLFLKLVNQKCERDHIMQTGPLQFLGDLKFQNEFEYYGFLGRGFQITLRTKRRKKRNHFQKFIGVGYSDKGAARNSSTDGSPSWQRASGEYQNVLENIVFMNSFKIREHKVLLSQRKSIPIGKTMDGSKRFFEFNEQILEDGTKVLLAENSNRFPVTWEIISEATNDLGSGFFPVEFKDKAGSIILEQRRRGIPREYNLLGN